MNQTESKTRNQSIKLILLGLLVATVIVLSSFHYPNTPTTVEGSEFVVNERLKRDVFEILEAKCNTCHQKQNPFMVFKLKNMERRADKIYKMVFKERKMPKGNDVQLTRREYSMLEKWLITQELY